MKYAFLVVVSLFLVPALASGGQTGSRGISSLVLQIESAVGSGNPARYLELLSPLADTQHSSQFASRHIAPGVTRAVVFERDRAPLTGTLPGDGYRLALEVFVERGRRAQIATWRVDIRRSRLVPQDNAEKDDEWRIEGQQQLAGFEGLHWLWLDPTRQFSARNLKVFAEDLELRLIDGSVFVAETEEGITAMVLIGRGRMLFAPAPATERQQVAIFSGAETLSADFDAAFVRLHPDDFESRVTTAALAEREVDPMLLRRAEALFQAEVGKSFSLDLGEISDQPWSLLPNQNDFLAEVRTRRYQTLTYARSGSEPEDISLFDRRRRRNISVYASKEKLATRGPFYSDDDGRDYEVLSYGIDVAFQPQRHLIDGVTRLRVRTRNNVVSLNVRLAESLHVRSVVIEEFGRVLTLRVRNQNSLVVSLPGPVPEGTELNLVVSYGGVLRPQSLDREILALQDQASARESIIIPPEPHYLYSNRSYWYAQAPVTNYATATIRLTVPAEYTAIASGDPVEGSPVVLPDTTSTGGGRRLFVFSAPQPLRYFSVVMARLLPVGSQVIPLDAEARNTDGELAPSGIFYENVAFNVMANPRQQGSANRLSQSGRDIIGFYGSLMGDYPYPSLSLGVLEGNLPGGHSPAYMVTLNQPVVTSPFSWGNDPAAFPSYPEFFIAHEIAHQWWGQAVGGKNYHEQWLSEAFAQYFAALYAHHSRGEQVFGAILRQFNRWAVSQSSQGPIYLGYRLGHIKGDSRVFRAIVYNKGAAVLHMLRRLVGDEAFFRSLRRYYAEWRFRKAGTDDLRRAFEQETGKSLERFFERWVFDSALPRVRFSHRVESGSDGSQAVLRFEQLGPVFDIPITVWIHYVDGSRADELIRLTESVTETRVPLTGRVRRIVANGDHAALVRLVRR
jgi:hypothetical protein